MGRQQARHRRAAEVKEGRQLAHAEKLSLCREQFAVITETMARFIESMHSFAAVPFEDQKGFNFIVDMMARSRDIRYSLSTTGQLLVILERIGPAAWVPDEAFPCGHVYPLVPDSVAERWSAGVPPHELALISMEELLSPTVEIYDTENVAPNEDDDLLLAGESALELIGLPAERFTYHTFAEQQSPRHPNPLKICSHANHEARFQEIARQIVAVSERSVSQDQSDQATGIEPPKTTVAPAKDRCATPTAPSKSPMEEEKAGRKRRGGRARKRRVQAALAHQRVEATATG